MRSRTFIAAMPCKKHDWTPPPFEEQRAARRRAKGTWLAPHCPKCLRRKDKPGH